MQTDLTDRLIRVVRDPDLRANLERGLSDYCHQSRNRLNSLKLSLYLVRRQNPGTLNPVWQKLEADYGLLESQFERVQAIYQPLTLTPVSLPLGLLFDDRRPAWAQIMADRGRQIEFEPPAGPAVARFDVTQLGEALDILVRWRAGQGGGGVKIRWGVDAGEASIDWSEEAHATATVLDDSRDPTFPWSLPMLSRVIEWHRGSMQIRTEPGWSLAMTWPC